MAFLERPEQAVIRVVGHPRNPIPRGYQRPDWSFVGTKWMKWITSGAKGDKMPCRGARWGGSSSLFAKGKESHSRADVEKVSSLPEAKGGQLLWQIG